MKKAIYPTLSILTIFILCATTSCKRDYKCSCTFNNQIVYSTDLGSQTKKNAQDDCNRNDSTIPGEVWNCSVNY
jgi:hypothetical protein